MSTFPALGVRTGQEGATGRPGRQNMTQERIEKIAAAIPVRLTRDEVAARLRCSPRTVDRWVARGLLKGIRIGRRVVFDLADVQAAERAGA